MGCTESNCRSNYPCPSQRSCPAEKTCPELTSINSTPGFSSDSVNIRNNIPVKNIAQCRQMAVWNDMKAYTYRKSNHPQAPNTCILTSHTGSAALQGKNTHLSGCVDNSKNFKDGC